MQEQQRNAKALTELSDDACELFLVRHGETPWNLEHRLQVVAACVTRLPPPLSTTVAARLPASPSHPMVFPAKYLM